MNLSKKFIYEKIDAPVYCMYYFHTYNSAKNKIKQTGAAVSAAK